MAVDNNEEKNKIVLNRKMRLWNKYKKPVIGVILAVVVIAVVAIVLKLCSIGKPVVTCIIPAQWEWYSKAV